MLLEELWLRSSAPGRCNFSDGAPHISVLIQKKSRMAANPGPKVSLWEGERWPPPDKAYFSGLTASDLGEPHLVA